MHNIPEPPIDPMADTNPTLLEPPHIAQRKRQRRLLMLGVVIVILMLGIGISLLALLGGNNNEPDTSVTSVAVVENATDEATATTLPTDAPPTATDADASDATDADASNATDADTSTDTPPSADINQALPTLSSEQLLALLQTPIPADAIEDNPAYDPFTTIPERPRNEFVDYVIMQGDTIDAIARRYNLEPESIAWCNDRRIILTIRPGDTLRIPPVDGACHPVLGTRNQTIAEIASDYGIDDPFQVIDSPYNSFLFGRSPDDVLPGGATIFLPGGEGELITWNPGSDIERNADGSVASVSFAPGQSGSCGAVAPGGGAYWANPLPAGTWVRGFYPGHTGIDLAAPVGTPIYAANSGPVLFSGFSQWGYGETVVIGHGPFSTLYGHMTTRNVSCGQFVTVGQVIGFVGSTGNSSGPHLHFEIRFDDTPQDPTLTAGIGW
jgi:murein DD-endopeptidase MepM/ murein hydrolase activator NlpD